MSAHATFTALVGGFGPQSSTTQGVANRESLCNIVEMAMLRLQQAGHLPINPIEFIAGRVLHHGRPITLRGWLWADTRAAAYEYLQELSDELGDDTDRLVKSHPTLYLRGGGQIDGTIPRRRPDGARVIAVWLATSEIPLNYRIRLLNLGQCEEFWGRPGTVPQWPESSAWRKEYTKAR